MVGGPGDGFPEHAVELGRAWGRDLYISGGDPMGDAEYVPARADPASVVLNAYYAARVPNAVVGWFRAAFPDAEVRLAGPE